MMSNWNRPPNCQMAASTAGIGPLYTMGIPQTKGLLTAGGGCTNNNPKMPSSRSLSSIFGVVGNFIQSITSRTNSTEAQISTLEKTKQSISAPDIYVDLSLKAPIFETTQGQAKLLIPENKEIYTCDQTKSLSAGNSPQGWCPILGHLKEINVEELGDISFIKMPALETETTVLTGKESSVRNRRMPHLICSPIKSTATSNDIKKDLRQIYDESELEENSYFTPMPFFFMSMTPSSVASMGIPQDISPSMFVPALQATASFSTSRNYDRRMSNASECDSEDSFVIFSEDVQMTTPSASPTVRKSFCERFNQLKSNRQISECSDDYIVFCDSDDDFQPMDCQAYETDSEESDEDDSDESDEDSCEEDTNETLSSQPDSGFEEKKVKFNLKPEVHVMRTWDYAYRAARKGEWEMAARDRERFKKRIEETEHILKPVLGRDVRERVYCERFRLLA